MTELLAISGSTRPGSANEAILQAVGRLYAGRVRLHLYRDIDRLPFFRPDLNAAEAEAPPPVRAFRDALGRADALLICSPEYVFSLPAVLKNALEWTVSTTVLFHKPCAFLVAAAGGDRAFASLDLILSTLVQEPIPASCKLLLRGARGKVDAGGAFTDAAALQAVQALMEALLQRAGRQAES